MPGASKKQAIENAVNKFLQQYNSNASGLSKYLQQDNLRMCLKTLKLLWKTHAPKDNPAAKAEAFAGMMSDMLLSVYNHISPDLLQAFAEQAAELIIEQIAEYKQHLMAKVALKALCTSEAPDLDVTCPHMTRLNILLSATQSLKFNVETGEIILPVEYDLRARAAQSRSIFFAGREYLPRDLAELCDAEKPEAQSKRSGFLVEVPLMPMSRASCIARAAHHFGEMLEQEDFTNLDLALVGLKREMFGVAAAPGDHVSKRLAYVRSAMDLIEYAVAEAATSESFFELDEFLHLKANSIAVVRNELLPEIQNLSSLIKQPAVISCIMASYTAELSELPWQIERSGVVTADGLYGFVVLHHPSMMINPQRFAHGPEHKTENKWVQYGPKAPYEVLCHGSNPPIVFTKLCPAYRFPAGMSDGKAQVDFSVGYLRKCQVGLEGTYVLPAVPASNQKARPSGDAKAIISGLAGRPDDEFVALDCTISPDEITHGIRLLGLDNGSMPEYANAVPRLFAAFGAHAPQPPKRKSRVKKIDWAVDHLTALLLERPWPKVQLNMFFRLATALIGLYDRQGVFEKQTQFFDELAKKLNTLTVTDRARMPKVLQLVGALQVFLRPVKSVEDEGYEQDRVSRRKALRIMANYFDEPFVEEERPHNVNKWLSMLPKMMRWSLEKKAKYRPGVACLRWAILHVQQYTTHGATCVARYASRFNAPAGFFALPAEHAAASPPASSMNQPK